MKLKLSFKATVTEAGCDEAGRGCLAGPVFAAAVILPKKFMHPLLNDSKKMSDAHRKLLRPIIEQEAISFAVGTVSVDEIDEINILRASFKAMHNAVRQLKVKPAHLLIDGNRFAAYPGIPNTCIIGGDGKYMNIAAASVLAKTYRDDYMDLLHEKFPNYGWKKNKGYGTLAHRAAISELGANEHHRKTFRLLPDQLKIF